MPSAPSARNQGSNEGGEVRSIGPSHSDHRGWQETVLDAFGTTSLDFMSKELVRLDAAHRNTREAYSDQQELNAALAAIAGVKPENEIQAKLAALSNDIRN